MDSSAPPTPARAADSPAGGYFAAAHASQFITNKDFTRRRSSTTSSLVDEGYSSGASSGLFDADELARIESLALTSPLGSPSEEMIAAQTYLSQQHQDAIWNSAAVQQHQHQYHSHQQQQQQDSQGQAHGLPSVPTLRSQPDVSGHSNNYPSPQRRAPGNLQPIIVAKPLGQRRSLPTVPNLRPAQMTGPSFAMRRGSITAANAAESPMTPMFTLPMNSPSPSPFTGYPPQLQQRHSFQDTLVSPGMMTPVCGGATTGAFFEPMSAISPLGVPPLWSPAAPSASVSASSFPLTPHPGGPMARRFSVPFLPDHPSAPLFAAPSAVFSPPKTHHHSRSGSSGHNFNNNHHAHAHGPVSAPAAMSPSTSGPPTLEIHAPPPTPSHTEHHQQQQYVFVNEDPEGSNSASLATFMGHDLSDHRESISTMDFTSSFSMAPPLQPIYLSAPPLSATPLSPTPDSAPTSDSIHHHYPTKQPQSQLPSPPPASPQPPTAAPTPTSSSSSSATPFKCACGKQFEKLSSLRSHARLHRAERKYECATCSRAFVRRQDLKRHTSTHDPQFKPYECSNCSTTFTRSDALHRHLKAKRCM
ncbi:hypothetical protein HDU89_003718 [Geranomyces variabilis]|nr:hypothetical protein HDU89_003718 [Geranomyces variabilis]